MIIISHRGNLNGPNVELENDPSQTLKALSLGFDVEVDVRCCSGRLFLGHDRSQYEVDEWFLKNPKLWCHAKDLEALKCLLAIDAHCFYHTDEDFVLTSRKKIWTSSAPRSGCFLVLPHLNTWKHGDLRGANLGGIGGICTDFPMSL